MVPMSAAFERVLVASMLVSCPGFATAQATFPTKPVRLISPYAPGGTNNTVARLLSQNLGERWGHPVIVDNRPGAGTIVGTEIVARSAPDGYTLLLASSTFVLVPQLVSTSYDPINDFAPIANIDKYEFSLVVNSSVPANSLKEFIALAKARPGQLNYASPGTGGVQHLAGEFLCIMTGIRMEHIPYKGAGPALVDLMSGQVQAYFASPVVAIPNVRSGKLKALAISGETRSPAMPQVPTFREAGLPGYSFGSWQGIVAPAGTPKAVVDKLSTDIARLLASDVAKAELGKLGMEPFTSTPAQFAALLRAEFAKYTSIVKAANIKVEH